MSDDKRDASFILALRTRQISDGCENVSLRRAIDCHRDDEMKFPYLMPCSLAEVVDHHALQAHAQLAASPSLVMTGDERAIVERIFDESERDLALFGHLIPDDERGVAA